MRVAASCSGRFIAPDFAPTHHRPTWNRSWAAQKRRPFRRRFSTLAQDPAIEAWVKGFPDASNPFEGTLGDCERITFDHVIWTCSLLGGPSGPGPFCHRVLLTLEEKHVPYSMGFVDFSNKPDWLFKVNDKGAVPVAKDTQTGEWVVDSAVIVDWLEDKFPEPALGKSESIPDVGSKVFPSFVQFLKVKGDDGTLKSTGDEAAAKEATLSEELQKLDSHLAQNGPFLQGNSISAGDLSLAPKLYHMTVALKTFKNWEMPAEFQHVHNYLETLQGRTSWQHTLYSPELVNAGWKKHLQE